MTGAVIAVPDVTSVAEHEENGINMDAMTADELIAERMDVWAEITGIEAQLADPTRIMALGADEYVLWRKRAIWALRYRKLDLRNVGDALMARRLQDLRAREAEQKAARDAEKAAVAEQKRLNKIENGWRPKGSAKKKDGPSIPFEEQERRRIDAQRRRGDVVAALQGKGGSEGLLLRMAVVIRHITLPGDDLPETFPDECRETLKEFSCFLKQRYGDSVVSAARTGRLTASSVIDTEPES